MGDSKIHHFEDPHRMCRTACGIIEFYPRSTWNTVTCRRCLRTAIWEVARQASLRAQESAARDEERRSLKGATDAELERF